MIFGYRDALTWFPEYDVSLSKVALSTSCQVGDSLTMSLVSMLASDATKESERLARLHLWKLHRPLIPVLLFGSSLARTGGLAHQGGIFRSLCSIQTFSSRCFPLASCFRAFPTEKKVSFWLCCCSARRHRRFKLSLRGYESITQMFTRFTDIINALKSLGKSYSNS